MPRFFFNIHDDAVTVDDQGVELSDVAAAREAALRSARELICEQVREGRVNLRHRIEIEDEDRRPVVTLPFASAIEIEGQ